MTPMLAWFGYSYWWFVIPGLLLGMYAQFKMMSTYRRYSEVGVQSGLTGAEAARRILDRAGLHQVPVEEVEGYLSDHYDPTHRALRLSSGNYHGRSVAAVGVAAHESGHALQHQESYVWLGLRSSLAPVTQFASMAWVGVAILGMILGGVWAKKLLGVAIGIFSVITLFQLVTLPVEFDASRRAKDQLIRLGLVGRGESEGISRVLNAAALTYVAALVQSVLELSRFVLMARDQRD